MMSKVVSTAVLAVVAGLTGFAATSRAGDVSCETKNSCAQKTEAVVMESSEGGSCEAKAGCSAKTETVGMEDSAASKNIVQTAQAAGKFNTLVAALTAADLVQTLEGGTFTVFAPTDEAFAKLPKETLESLLKPENKDQLKAILTYHVVAGEARSSAFAKDTSVNKDTVNGKSIEIKNTDGKITVNGANVVGSDVQASNGVVHIIDAVILPPQS